MEESYALINKSISAAADPDPVAGDFSAVVDAGVAAAVGGGEHGQPAAEPHNKPPPLERVAAAAGRR